MYIAYEHLCESELGGSYISIYFNWSQYDENTRTHSWKISCNANLKMFQGQNKIIIFFRVWLYVEETQIIHACRPTTNPMKKELGSDSSIIVSGLNK